MEKWCTNKNYSYKHNEQINKQNIDNSECFGELQEKEELRETCWKENKIAVASSIKLEI
jgi:hypothetical protein